jgi:hypothetical protein
MKTNKLNICRVCGYYDSTPPWGEDGKSPTFEYCPCCGVQHGYGDCLLAGIQRQRELWKEKNYEWDMPRFKPKNWNLEKQIENIPPEFK